MDKTEEKILSIEKELKALRNEVSKLSDLVQNKFMKYLSDLDAKNDRLW